MDGAIAVDDAWTYGTFLRRILAIGAGAVILSAIGCGGAAPPAPQVERLSISNVRPDPALFVPGELGISTIGTWKGRPFVSTAVGIFSIDVEKAVATPLVGLHGDRAISVCMLGTTPFVLTFDQSLRLYDASGSTLGEVSLPSGAEGSDEARIAADSHSLVLINDAGDSVLRLASGRWTRIQVSDRVRDTRGLDSFLLDNDILYVGNNSGEWGGSLGALDLSTGQWSKLMSSPMDPIDAVVRAPNGDVWAASAVTHMGLLEGALFVQRDRRLVERVRTGKLGPPRHGWDLPDDWIEGLAFDDAGRPIVVGGRLGASRLDGEHWTRLTPGWRPDDVDLSGVVVQGTMLVIAVEGGVLLWDWHAGSVRRVNLVCNPDPSDPGLPYRCLDKPADCPCHAP